MGFWSDLGGDLLDMGKNEVQSRIDGRYGSDHIQAQNDTVAYMGQVIDAVHARTFTVEEGVGLINKAVNAFVQLASRFGERGRQGASEVSALAASTIRDLRAGSTPAPGGGPGTGYYNSPGTLESYLPWVLGIGALAFVFSGRRAR